MNTQMLRPVTTQFPLHWRHSDDTTLCANPDTCARDLHLKSGPAPTWKHRDDDTPCTTPHECSHIGRDAYLPGGVSE